MSYDDERLVVFDHDERVVVFDEDLPLLPEQTADDTSEGWGERKSDNDDRLLEERPPHWD